MSKIQSLKINPFTLNSINHPTIDIESLNDIQNKFELELDKTCQYMGQNFERCTIGSRHGVKLKFQKC